MRFAVYVDRADPDRALFHPELYREGADRSEYEFAGLFEAVAIPEPTIEPRDGRMVLTEMGYWSLTADDVLRGDYMDQETGHEATIYRVPRQPPRGNA